ncbi:MAG: hypothetical protein FWE37_03025 [Spirochaetaceae bacterium]|nr:hypothetical protein [Spirochaetaceae bacterium]
MTNTNYGTSAAGVKALTDNPIMHGWAYFNGVLLGCVMDNITVSQEATTVDILSAQKGTGPQDQVITALAMTINMTLASPKRSLRALVDPNFKILDNGQEVGASKLFDSLKQGRSGALKMVRSVNGAPSTDPNDVICFYEVFPNLAGDVVELGNAQQQLAITFNVILKEFTELKTYDANAEYLLDSAFYYYTDKPRGVPPVEWPIIPELSHDGTNIYLDYADDDIEQNGELRYEVLEDDGEGKIVRRWDGMGEVRGNRVIITPQLNADEAGPIELSSSKGVYLFGNAKKLIHKTGIASAMLPQALVTFKAS